MSQQGFVLADEGIYFGKIVDWGFNKTGNGTPYFFLKVSNEAKEGETGDREPVDQPFTATVYLYLSQAARESSFGTIKYLGFDREKRPLEHLKREHPKAHSFFGEEVYLRCTHEEYNGRTNAKFQIQKRTRAAKPEDVDAILAELNASFASEGEEAGALESANY